PYLLAVAMASNVGSTATITGNPQNIMVGSLSHIPYATFAAALGPVALAGLVVTLALIALFHRDEFTGALPHAASKPKVEANHTLVIRALSATLVLGVLFFYWCRTSQGGDRHRRPAIADPPGQEPAHLCRDRLVAAADVRRPVYHRRRRRRNV